MPVERVQITAFALGGVFAAAGGALLLGQTSVGQPSSAANWPLAAIAICVVGGVALTGGVGRIEDVLAATLLLGVIANGLNQLNVSPYWQPTVTGLVILLAVVLDQFTRRRRAGAPGPRTAPASSSASSGIPTTGHGQMGSGGDGQGGNGGPLQAPAPTQTSARTSPGSHPASPR